MNKQWSTYNQSELQEKLQNKGNRHSAMFLSIRAQLMHFAFYELFEVISANTPELIAEAHRVRYQVFCLENTGYEDPSEHPDGLERDRYDKNAKHALMIHRASGKAIGTVRVILPDPDDLMDCFPMQRACNLPCLKDPEFILNACEVSRLAIKREFQKHMIATCKRKLYSYFRHDKEYNQGVFHKFLMSSGIDLAPMGLIRGMLLQAIDNERMLGLGLMEPRHIRSLVKAGLVMQVIGPAVNYHGVRVPFAVNIPELFEHTKINSYAMWNVVSNRGELHAQLNQVLAHHNSFSNSMQLQSEWRTANGTF